MPSPEKFKDSLTKFKIDKHIIMKINEGYENLVSSSNKKLKALYFKQAMDIFDCHLTVNQKSEILDYNGCCKGGQRAKNSQKFYQENQSLTIQEKIQKISAVPYMGTPRLLDDGTIYICAVEYYLDGKYRCACPNYNNLKIDYDVSQTYCMCCAGHFRHHYQIMLNIKLNLKEVVSSPFTSRGEMPCAFIFEIVN